MNNNEIIIFREKHGFSRKELADFLGLERVEEKLIAQWEKTGDIPIQILNKLSSFPAEPILKNPDRSKCRFTQIDLFAGTGGIRQGFQRQGAPRRKN